MESGFRIDNILLLESSFSRINHVVFQGEIRNDLNVHTDVAVNDDQVTVGLEVSVVQSFEGTEQVKIKVKTVGIFTRIGESQITDLNAFGRVNGAAIIFPFVREIIANTSIKAGLPAIMVPPINFTATSEDAPAENPSGN